MTFTADEARELVETAAQKKLQLLVSCPWHYTAHGKEARRLIRAGALGQIKMISILMTNPIDKLLRGINTSPTHGMEAIYIEPCKGSYNDPDVAGGGQIYCQASHIAAYLTFLTGLRPSQVYSRFDYDGSQNDIYNALTVTLENGALASIATTAATPLSERNYEVRIFGSKAILQLELWRGTMTLINFADKRTEFQPLAPGEIYPEQSPALNFIDTVLGKAANGSPGELGLASMEIIEAACESARTNRSERIRAVKSAPVDEPATVRQQA
jgi:predicted dehydrogenase